MHVFDGETGIHTGILKTVKWVPQENKFWTQILPSDFVDPIIWLLNA